MLISHYIWIQRQVVFSVNFSCRPIFPKVAERKDRFSTNFSCGLVFSIDSVDLLYYIYLNRNNFNNSTYFFLSMFLSFFFFLSTSIRAFFYDWLSLRLFAVVLLMVHSRAILPFILAHSTALQIRLKPAVTKDINFATYSFF